MTEQSEFDTARLCQYIPKGDGYNTDFSNDLSDAVAFIQQQAAELAALREENQALEDEQSIFEDAVMSKDKEIAVLRKFASYIISIKNNIDVVDINDAARDYYLIDQSGNPTPLLTGETE